MIRFYVKLILPIALIFLALTLTARALGTTQPPNPALRGFTEGCEDKPQPCWYGIIAGKDTMLFEEASKLLEAEGFQANTNRGKVEQTDFTLEFANYFAPSSTSGCNVHLEARSQQNYFIRLTLFDCKGISIADMLDLYGLPHNIQLRENESGKLYFNRSTITAQFSANFSPLSYISNISFYPLDLTGGYPYCSWHGYLPYWLYYNLDPDSTLCSKNAWGR